MFNSLKALCPEPTQKVNQRRLKRAVNKFRKALHREVKGAVHIHIGFEIPVLMTQNGHFEIVKVQEIYSTGIKKE